MSFLDDSYLGSLHNAEITVLPTVEGLKPVRTQTITEEQLRATAAMNQPIAAQTNQAFAENNEKDSIQLPGGIRMPKETFYILLAAVVIIAVYYFSARKKEK